MKLGRSNPHRAFEKRIGYRFKNRALLEMALTHRSFRFETPEVNVDNQRLEFLGDAVLGFLAADELYRRFEDDAEGHLTAMRSQATSGKALAEIAAELDLGAFLKIGRGEAQSGGRERESNLADALESVIGAAFVDGGLRAAQKVFTAVFGPVLDAQAGDPWADNPKGKLQEVCQSRWKAGPVYKLVKEDGPSHDRVFTSEVRLGRHVHGRGRGANKQASEKAAAADALRRLAKRP